jgi:FlaA1/EpsC-like NDP-sugar epimerase
MRNRIFLALDLLLVTAIVAFSFTAWYAGAGWWLWMRPVALTYVAVAIPLKVALFFRVGLYRRLWLYASIVDLEVALVACLLGAVVSFGVGLLLIPSLLGHAVPTGILVLDSALTAAAITLPRLLLRLISRRVRQRREMSSVRHATPDGRPAKRRVLIVGAGAAGGMVAKEMLDHTQIELTPVGFVDDDPTKHGHRLLGLPVFGSIASLPAVVQRCGADEVIIALPSAPGKMIREIMRLSAAAGVRTRTVPGLSEILSGAKAVSLRPIQIQDLLRRDPIETDLEQVASLVAGRVVLVTGAGGSIGSELCRQLAQLEPAQIVALGRGENSIFELIEEMRVTAPRVAVAPVIADVRDGVRMRAVFEQFRPFSVFHAAAHKHVPLMESSIDEAILNNVLGTRNVAELSEEFDVGHLVLISSDKAVRPTSIMGASKRIAERSVCAVAERSGRPYVSVRFGNVLGSRGSVVPTFMRQIAAGGPITITHRDMRRYFMTIPEAVQLVLQAAALGRGSEVFVLDMGEPVRISDLAEDLIRLSGLEVGSDIEIAYTGIRPGEKMAEELFFGPDDATPTSHPKILRARDESPPRGMDASIDRLIEAARRRAPESVLRRMMRSIVPGYTPSTFVTPLVAVNGSTTVVTEVVNFETAAAAGDD